MSLVTIDVPIPRSQLEAMTVNERLFAARRMDAFDGARANRNLEAVREILEAVYVDELSIARTLRDIASTG